MITHHVLSVLLWPYALLSSFGEFYLLLFLSSEVRHRRVLETEVQFPIAILLKPPLSDPALFLIVATNLHRISPQLSTPLLQLRSILRETHGKESAEFKSLTVAFGASFLLVRTASIPFLLYSTFTMSYEEHSGSLPRWAWKVARVTLPLPSLLNAFWTWEVIGAACRTRKWAGNKEKEE